MQGNTKRGVLKRNVVVAASATKTKMRIDDANGKENDSNTGEEGRRAHRRSRGNQSDSVTLGTRSSAPSDSLARSNRAKIKKAFSDLSNSRASSRKNILMIGSGKEGEVVVENFVDKKMDIAEEKVMAMEEEEEEEEGEKEINYRDHEISKLSQDEEKIINSDPTIETHFEATEELYGRTSSRHSRTQSIVNLVMWKEVPKTAFIFGFGTFVLVSSYFAKDFNFSLISVSSYVGLLYLAFMFLYKSILRRGENMEPDENYIMGEEEAIWLLKLLLPYVNELLLKLRGLFSGDPAATLKLAVFLFAMARCGNCITIWSLAKLLFFGFFTVPKICSSYSPHMAKFGRFWLERTREGWESCSHKKAVGTAIFILIWNITSVVARIWTFFMVLVAAKLYQQSREKKNIPWQEKEV